MSDAPVHDEILDSRDDRSPEDERVAALMEHTIDVPIFAEAVEQQRPADAADTLEDLETEAVEVLQQMEDQAAAEALAEMETPLAISVLDDLVQEDRGVYARTLLERMAPDDAADLLQAISERDRENLLRHLAPESAARLRRLVSYPEDSAGGLMTTDFLSLRTNTSVGEAIEKVRDVVETERFPQGMQHLMVMDDDDHLAGVISLRDLLLSPNRSSVADVMNPDVASVVGPPGTRRNRCSDPRREPFRTPATPSVTPSPPGLRMDSPASDAGTLARTDESPGARVRAHSPVPRVAADGRGRRGR